MRHLLLALVVALVATAGCTSKVQPQVVDVPTPAELEGADCAGGG
jgi:hypothetical protein